MPYNVAEMTPGGTNHTAQLFIAAWLYLNSPPKAPHNWGLFNPSLNNDHSDPMEISSAFWILDILA
jgi:hypothetical protein